MALLISRCRKKRCHGEFIQNFIVTMSQFSTQYGVKRVLGAQSGEVLKFERITAALSAIQEKKDRLNLVITDVHQSNTNGFEILQYIEKEFNLPVISMSPSENANLLSIGLSNDAKLYFVKSLSVNDFKTIWQYANAKERGKATTSAQRASVQHENVVEASLGNTSSFCEVTRGYKKCKRKEPEETHELNEVDRDDSPNEKKRRVVWTDWMHCKFLEAIEQLGHESAFPKKIAEVMNVPGLTRENVASHLQKYRMCMKRAQEGLQSTDSSYGINFTTHVKGTFFSSSHSAVDFDSCLLHPEASTSTSNLGHGQLPQVSNQRSLQYPYALNVSSLDAIARNNTNFLDFGTVQPTAHIGLAQVDSGHVPSGLIRNINSRTILSSIESRGASNNPNRALSSFTSSTYVGYRLAGNGKSVESGQMGISGSDENRTDKANLSVEGSGNESLVQYPSTYIDYVPQQQPFLAGNGKSVESGQMRVSGSDDNRTDKANLSVEGSGNESLVQYPSTSIDYIPQQQPSLAGNGKSVDSGQMVFLGNDGNRTDKANLPAEGSGNESLVQHPSTSIDDIPQQQPSLPPFPSIPVDFDSFGAEGEMDVLLNATGSTSPQIFWNGDFYDSLFNHTD